MDIKVGTQLKQVHVGNNDWFIGQVIKIASEECGNVFVADGGNKYSRKYLEDNFEIINQPQKFKKGDCVERICGRHGGMGEGEVDYVRDYDSRTNCLSLERFGSGHDADLFETITAAPQPPSPRPFYQKMNRMVMDAAMAGCWFTSDTTEEPYESRIEADLNKLKI